MMRTLSSVIAQNAIRIAPEQQKILENQFDRNCSAVLWTENADVSRADIVVLAEPPRMLKSDTLIRSLRLDATVIIPFSENPCFDFIKSKLYCHGTVGAATFTAPHHFWWGGLIATPRAKKATNSLRDTHVVSCVRRGTREEVDALILTKYLTALGVSYTIDVIDERDDLATPRIAALLRALDTTGKPVVWLDPADGVGSSGLDPNFDSIDFAAIHDKSAGFKMSFLYFGRSRAARELLINWRSLSREFPALTPSHALDTAWGMISAQRHLVTRWLTVPKQGLAPSGVDIDPAPSIVADGDLNQHQAVYQTRPAQRVSAPEPHYIKRGQFSGGGPVTFVTLADGTPIDEAASLCEDIAEAFDLNDGGFSALAVVLCRNIHEATATINSAKEGWVLYAWPGTQIDSHLFEQLQRHRDTKTLSYFGMQPTNTMRSINGVATLSISKARIAFGRARDFLEGAAASSLRFAG